jgi:uncharacterized membrane protein
MDARPVDPTASSLPLPPPPPSPSPRQQQDEKVRRIEWAISTLLRAGVVTSVVIILAGMGMTFAHHPEYRSSRPALARLTRPGATEFPTSPREVMRGLAEFQGRAVVVLGVLLLIATPILRVAASAVAFAYERDWPFATITLVVLALLTVSFVLGKVE